jgi:hypothetical protein
VPTVQLKWHNLNIGFRLSINTGAGLVLWIGCFFRLLWLAERSPAVERLFPVALTGLTGAFVSFLIKRNSNNRIDSAERISECKNGFTSVEK